MRVTGRSLRSRARLHESSQEGEIESRRQTAENPLGVRNQRRWYHIGADGGHFVVGRERRSRENGWSYLNGHRQMRLRQRCDAHSSALVQTDPLGLRGPPQMLRVQFWLAHSNALVHWEPLTFFGPPQTLTKHF